MPHQQDRVPALVRWPDQERALVPEKLEVAFKRVRPGMDSRSILRRFEAECAILAALEHLYIARPLPRPE